MKKHSTNATWPGTKSQSDIFILLGLPDYKSNIQRYSVEFLFLFKQRVPLCLMI